MGCTFDAGATAFCLKASPEFSKFVKKSIVVATGVSGFSETWPDKESNETLCSKTETSWKAKININMHRFQKSSTFLSRNEKFKGHNKRAKNKKVTTSKVKSKTTQKRYEDNKEKRNSTFGFWFPSHFKAKTSFLLHVLAQEVACLCKIGLLLCLAVFQHVCLARKLSAIFSPQNNERKFCVTGVVFVKILIWKT